MTSSTNKKYTNTYKKIIEKETNFWRNKPVMKSPYHHSNASGNIVTNEKKCLEKCDLPNGFEWKIVDITETEEIENIISFINDNSKENRGFKFFHTLNGIIWEMGENAKFACVRCGENICGVIGYSKKKVRIYDDVTHMMMPMFMTVGKKYRSMGMGRMLINMVINESIAQDINQGMFFTERLISTPITEIRFFFRPLDYLHLHNSGFVDLGDVDINVTHDKTKIRLRPGKNFKVVDKTKENINIVFNFYKKYMETFTLSQEMSIEEIEKYLFSKDNVKTILVYENGEPVDFISYNFYFLKNDKGDVVKCGNLLMYSSLETREDILVIDLMKQMSLDGCHAFFMNDLMGNSSVSLSTPKFIWEDYEDEETCFDLNFVSTNKVLMINFFNWKCQSLKTTTVSWPLY
jgi:predicted DNA-binding antitoxin AbrB/MazE fold protein